VAILAPLVAPALVAAGRALHKLNPEGIGAPETSDVSWPQLGTGMPMDGGFTLEQSTPQEYMP
jgi:hypothetical protein